MVLNKEFVGRSFHELGAVVLGEDADEDASRPRYKLMKVFGSVSGKEEGCIGAFEVIRIGDISLDSFTPKSEFHVRHKGIRLKIGEDLSPMILVVEVLEMDDPHEKQKLIEELKEQDLLKHDDSGYRG